MIDKIVPRKIDSSIDYKLLPKNSMIDALNVIVSEYESTSESNKGSAGVLKNVKSNAAADFVQGQVPSFSDNLEYRVIGNVVDEKNKVIYFFVFCADHNNNAIIAYDKNDVLPVYGLANSFPFDDNDYTGSPKYKLIFKSPLLNFKQDGFVSASIVYTQNSAFYNDEIPELVVPSQQSDEILTDPIIYFTDNYNEPRKINPYRALVTNSYIEPDYDSYDYSDFLSACPRTPLNPITHYFNNDSSKTISNFKNTRGFQFAYKFIYKDKIHSSISSYSSIAVPQVIVNQGNSDNVNYLAANRCVLSIPFGYQDSDGNPKKPQEVERIKILAREGDSGRFLEIDEVDANSNSENWSQSDWTYNFYNDRIQLGVSDEEVQKQYDNVPQLAQAVTTADNRLFYGNYVEGYDNVKTSCTAQVLFYEGQADAEEYAVGVSPAIFTSFEAGIPVGGGNNDFFSQINSGFVLDMSSMPNALSAGTTIELSLNFTPDSNYHIYQKALNNYHQTTLRGENIVENQYGDQEAWEEYTSNWLPASSNTAPDAGGDYILSKYNDDGVVPYFGRANAGGGGFTNTTINWIGPSQTKPVIYGSSAANSVIIQGKTISFSVSLTVNNDITTGARALITEEILNYLVGGEDYDGDSNVSLNSVQNVAEIDIDLGLSDYSKIDLGTPLAKMITGVRNSFGATNPENQIETPVGYFIVNKCKAKFSLGSAFTSEYEASDSRKGFYIDIDSITDVEALTCVRRVYWNGFDENAPSQVINHNGPWYTLSSSLAQNPNEIDNNLDQFVNNGNNLWTINSHADFVGSGNYRNLLGYLDFADDQFLDNDDQFSVLDGEGGCGSFSGSTIDSPYTLGEVLDNYASGRDSIFIDSVFTQGSILLPEDPEASTTISGLRYTTMQHVLVSSINAFATQQYQYHLYYDLTTTPNAIELLYSTFSLEPPLENNVNRSFKTNAFHEFGIVYYDQKGRHGFVNPLTTAFVAGYSDQERPVNGKGRVNIELTLNHAPPAWAHYYKIAYTGNTSIDSFTQYSSGGAFAPENTEGTYGNNIYVSLNYLQGNQISYSSSFGGRSPQGDLDLYKFREGDRVRILSYYDQSNTRKYPFNADFEIIDVVTLGEAENPLSDNPTENQKGQFLVLKDNPEVNYFSLSSVKNGFHKWGDNTIIEIYSPSKYSDRESKIFYEMSNTYNVIFTEDDEGNVILVHETPILVLTEGDVWWRKVAVNLRQNISSGVSFNEQYTDISNAGFIDLISETPDSLVNNPSESRFLNLYLESSTFSDLMQGDSLGYGRVNVINPEAKRVRRDHSITYSARSNPSGNRVFYSDFNQYLLNFKDLTESYGAVNYIDNYGDSLFCLQENKCSVIPVSRNILSDAAGSTNIVSSRQVLGDTKYYSGFSGCDNNPESVQNVDNTYYFANKSVGRVYHFTGSGGVSEISKIGMSTELKNEFKKTIFESIGRTKPRIVGGYDPKNDEYILTMLSGEDPLQAANSPVFILQRTGQQLDAVIPSVIEPEAFEPVIASAPEIDVLETIQRDGLTGEELRQITTQANQNAVNTPSEVRSNTQRMLADINNDGTIGTSDLLKLLQVYGENIDTSLLNILVIYPEDYNG